MVFRSEEAAGSIRAFLAFVKANRITVIDLPTSFWHIWAAEIDEHEEPVPEGVRIVIVGGEEAASDKLAAWQRVVGGKVLWSNTYGPTEATIAATVFEPEFAIANR